jgi:hypothetical protein
VMPAAGGFLYVALADPMPASAGSCDASAARAPGAPAMAGALLPGRIPTAARVAVSADQAPRTRGRGLLGQATAPTPGGAGSCPVTKGMLCQRSLEHEYLGVEGELDEHPPVTAELIQYVLNV